MLKNKPIPALFLLLFALLLFSSATALDYFSVNANPAISMCQCSSFNETWMIKNTGTTPSSYQLYSENAAYSTFLPASFILEPGHSINILHQAAPACSDPKTFDLNTKIITATKTFVVMQSVKVIDCFGYSISVAPEDAVVCTDNQLVAYDVLLKNNGIYKQGFAVGTSTDSAKILPSVVGLEAGAEKKLQMLVNVSCSTPGLKKIWVGAAILGKNGYEYSLLRLNVLSKDSAYKPIIYPGMTKINYFPVNKTFTIKNSGKIRATYYVYADAPGWIELEDFSAVLSPGETKSFAASFAPEKSIPESLYNFTIVAEAGDSVYAEEISVVLSDTFWSKYIAKNILILSALLALIVLFVILLIILKKIGVQKRKKLIKEFLEADELEIAERSVGAALPSVRKKWNFIKPGAIYNLGIAQEEFAVTKISLLAKKPLRNAELQISLEREAPLGYYDIEGTPQKVCQMFLIRRKKLFDKVLEKIIVRFRVPLKWLKENKVNARHISLFRLRNKLEEFRPVFKGCIDGYCYYEADLKGFSFFVIAKSSDRKTEKAGITPSKEESDFESEIKKQEAKEVQLKKLAEKKIRETKKARKKKAIKKQKHEEGSPAGMIFILLILLILFLVAFKYYKPEKQNLITTFMEDANSTNLTAITPLINLALPEVEQNPVDVEINELVQYIDENRLGNTLYFQVWNKNTKKIILLSEYFTAPDGTALSFGASKPANVSALVEGSTLTLIPPQGWYGIDHVYVAVSNGQGFFQDADITLVVRDHAPTSADKLIASVKSAFSSENIKYTFAAILLIAIIIFMIVIFRIPKKKKQTRRLNKKRKKTKQRR